MIEEGTKYQISQSIKEYFNLADDLTVIRDNGVTVQFILGEGKSRGSMPVSHLQYLLKKSVLTKLPNKRDLLNTEDTDEQTG